ncbi:MAG: ABC transporter ATP-binding protein [Pseudomonadales bacterium]|jgi:ABC-2 type transport system ATP-binding protein|nr:ABC transporter ATP-binding protein [Pseudomonadales bacterium]
MSVISAQGLRKKFGNVHALDGFDLQVEPGRIVGLIGPNGSGKTTALKSILGMAALDAGHLDVLSFQPKAQRAALMQHVAYIADTGILPRWMRVKDLLEYVDAVNPSFDIARAREALARTDVQLEKKIKVLSKGMHVQLHLAIVLAIGAQLLVLDEPTLGLDILYRQQFYDGVLNDYFNEQRSILITTHEVREVEHILTDVVFIHRGKACLSLAMDDLPDKFFKLTSAPNQTLPPGALQTRPTLAGTESIYNNTGKAELQPYGEVSTPNLAELFVAVVESQHV